MNKALKCSRRTAIKAIAAGGAGFFFGGNITGSPMLLATEKRNEDEKESGKIVSRSWSSLGEKIGLLGMGCMRFPSLSTEDGKRGPLDQEQVNRMIDYALEHGINYFDTAPAYGESEKVTGIALSRHDRDSYLLATKMSNFHPKTQTLESAKEIFSNSLNNLKTDYFDYFLLHSVGSIEDFQKRFIDNGVLQYLLDQKQEGRIRHLGFSFHGSNDSLKELVSLPYKWDFVQIQMNYVDWKKMGDNSDSETLYNILSEKGIPVAVMEPIRGGALANVNKILKGKLADRFPELSPAGVALSFAASFPGVMTTLSGMSNMAQLIENVKTFSEFKPFSVEDNDFLMDIARLYSANPHVPCTGCRYCMPCPRGVDIPGNFSLYNSLSDELNLPDPDGAKDDEFKRKKSMFINSYYTLDEKARASACVKCRICVDKCPQKIRIPEKLEMIRSLADKLDQ